MFKKITMAVAAVAIAASAGLAQAQEMRKVRIGTEGAYPLIIALTSSGELAGFDIDIAKAICEQA